MKTNLLSRLDAANQRLIAISGSVPHIDDRQYREPLSTEMLRYIGYDLISLAGELTTLGVDMTRRTAEHPSTTNKLYPL